MENIKLNDLEKRLLRRYKEIYRLEQPCWAFKIPPPIPFVGNNLDNAPKRVLSYASAENLSFAYDENLKPISDNYLHNLSIDKQFIRSRHCYEKNKESRNNKNANSITNMPFVHITPFNNGSQLAVTRYILSKLTYNDFSYKPYEFIEQIAVANFGKFSIRSNKNRDYANNSALMGEMIPYITNDISTIQPDIIILPKTIFQKVEKWENILRRSEIKREILFVLIYQVNRTNVNCHIMKKLESIEEPPEISKFTEWLCEPKRFNKEDLGRDR
jgi:hypothetical protein